MEGKRALVVETINKLVSASNAKAKVQHIEQLEELLLRNEPALLDGFLSELVPLQMDKAVSVRRKLLEFVAAAVRVRPGPAVLKTAVPCVAGLLSDEQPQLAREAAQAAHTLLSRGLNMLAQAPQGDAAVSAAVNAAWAQVQGLQRDLSNMAVSLCGSHGGSSSRQLAMCLAGIKMAEQAVLQYTADAVARLPAAQPLQAEVQRLMQLLMKLVAVPDVKQRAGPVVIAAVKGMGQCCLQRPQLLQAMLPPLLELAQQGVFRAPKPDVQQSGVEASCGSAVKDILVRVYRSSNSEAVKPYRQQLHQALETMGAEAAAASALRHLERQAARAKEGHKRKATDQAGRDPKQQRATTPAAADSSYGNTPTRTPTPTPTPMTATGGGVDFPTDLMSLFRPGPGVNLGEALNNAQQVLEVLVQAGQEEAVKAILGCVAPEVLAELVTRWMENLPPDKPGAPAEAQQPQQAAPPAPMQPAAAAAAAAAGGQAAPMQFDAAGLSQFLASQQQQAPQQQQAKPQQATDPRQKRAAAVAAAAAAAAQPPAPAGPPPAAPAGPQLPRPLPRALQPQQVSAMRTAAVQRILRATGNKPIRNFRELLLSRLASRAPESEGLTALMLQHVFADYHLNRGHVLLVRWLYALAAAVAPSAGQAQQQQRQDQQQEPGVGKGSPAAAAAEAAGGDVDMPDAAAAAAAAEPGAAQPAAAAAAGAGAAAAPQGDADTAMEEAPDSELARAAAEAAAAVAAAEAEEDKARAARRQARNAGQGDPALHRDQQQQQVEKEQQHPQQQDATQRSNTPSNSKQQQQDSSSQVADLSGTPYESVLMSSLQGLKENLPSTDPAIPRLLQDAPVLPLQAVTSFLQELIAEGSDWAGVSLSSAYGLFESRPAARQALLRLMLDAAVSADSLAREKAVGLIVSKLMGWEAHAAAVLEFARQHLLLLLQPAPAAVNGGDEQQKQGGNASAAVGDQQQQGGGPGSGDVPKAAAAAAEGAGEAAEAQQQQQQQQQVMDVEAAAQHSMLYLSLCTIKPELLQLLLETYGKAGPDARTALSRYAPSLALAIGPSAPKLLQLIRQPPDGSQDLLLAMLTALSDQQLPPEALMQACTAHYKATGSVQLMDPVVGALSKDSVVQLLPKLLTQLPDQRLRLLYRRLALAQHEREAMFAPVELLVLLHKVTSEMPQAMWKAHNLQIISAVDRAMRTPEVFPAAVMQMAITRMEAMNPPPRLFMRSVTIMVTNAATPLMKWVIALLERLIQKQVWDNKTQWKGFLVCCEKLADHGSALVLLQLPENILEQALGQVNRSLWKKLYDVAYAANCPVVLYKGVRQVVDKFYEKWMRAEVEQKQADLAAKQAAAAAAAAGGGSGGSTAAGAAAGSGQKAGRASLGGGGGAGAKPKAQAGSAVAAGAAAAAAGEGAAQQLKPGDSSGQQQPAAAAAAAAAAAEGNAAKPAAAAAAPQESQPVGTGVGLNDDDDEFVLDFEDEDEG